MSQLSLFKKRLQVTFHPDPCLLKELLPRAQPALFRPLARSHLHHSLIQPSPDSSLTAGLCRKHRWREGGLQFFFLHSTGLYGARWDQSRPAEAFERERSEVWPQRIAARQWRWAARTASACLRSPDGSTKTRQDSQRDRGRDEQLACSPHLHLHVHDCGSERERYSKGGASGGHQAGLDAVSRSVRVKSCHREKRVALQNSRGNVFVFFPFRQRTWMIDLDFSDRVQSHSSSTFAMWFYWTNCEYLGFQKAHNHKMEEISPDTANRYGRCFTFSIQEPLSSHHNRDEQGRAFTSDSIFIQIFLANRF